MLDANTLAHKPGKISCVNSLGELVKTWREGSGLSARELADRVGGKVKRQHIEQLEAAGSRLPRYLPDLAAAMGTTADDLLKLKMPPLLGQVAEHVGSAPVKIAPPPKPPPGFQDPQHDTGWQVLHDLEDLHPADRAEWIASLHRLAEKSREIGKIHAEKVMIPIKEKAKKS
jgi:transcriptional regulator with XRE-family HTH domain